MWKDITDESSRSKTPTLLLVEPLASLQPNEIKFFCLPGSGVGGQYVFQGTMDLGYGQRKYNLTIFGYGTDWSVDDITDGFFLNVNDPTLRERGLQLGQALVYSLPSRLYANMQLKHSLEWLIDRWNNATV